jgi:hypothetical protein
VYLDQPVGTPVFLDLFGMVFFFNLEPEPDIVLPEDIARLGFELVSLQTPLASSASAK